MLKDLESGEHDHGFTNHGLEAFRGTQTVPAPLGVAHNQQLKLMKPCVRSVKLQLRICKILLT